MALTSIPDHQLPKVGYALTGRVCHRTTVWVDQDDDIVAALCGCGAVWSELNDPPATEWYHTHPAPTPPARAAA